MVWQQITENRAKICLNHFKSAYPIEEAQKELIAGRLTQQLCPRCSVWSSWLHTTCVRCQPACGGHRWLHTFGVLSTAVCEGWDCEPASFRSFSESKENQISSSYEPRSMPRVHCRLLWGALKSLKANLDKVQPILRGLCQTKPAHNLKQPNKIWHKTEQTTQ